MRIILHRERVRTRDDDVAYIEKSGGRFQAWTYSDGQRVSLGSDPDSEALRRRLSAKGYKVTMVDAAADAMFSSAELATWTVEQLGQIERKLWDQAAKAGEQARDFEYQRKTLEEQARAIKREIEKRGRNA